MIALTFALPDESRTFAAALEARSVLDGSGHLPVITGRWAGKKVMVIHTGVGELSAYRLRLQELLAGKGGSSQKPTVLISSGYAGGLQPGLHVGDLILGKNVSDPALLQKAGILLTGPTVHAGALTTQSSMAETVESKTALGKTTGAAAVDMETAWIANVCAESGVPILSLRVISDAVGQAFPVPGAVLFDARRQRPRYVALPAWLLAHPGKVQPFVRFVRGLGVAQTQLTSALKVLVAGL